MGRRILLMVLAFGVAGWPAARADVIVTLEAFDADENLVTGPVEAGSTIVVDILLSVTEEDDPLFDVRAMQFDFSLTDAEIETVAFVWQVDPNAYGFVTSSLPVPAAVSLITEESDLLVALTEEPIWVGSVEVTVNGSGTINAVGGTGVGQGSQARIEAGFEEPLIFALGARNLRGDTLEIEATETEPPPDNDSDDDGVPDDEDAFPDDPTETTDTDGDGIGDNADEDDDNDGVPDEEDAFPLDPEERADSDGDGVGDNADAFPDDPDETVDTDGDGIGNNADPDDDGDGVPDSEDAFPLDPTEWADSDGDGIGDNAERNANRGPRVSGLCGVIAPGTSAMLLLGLSLISLGRRR